MATKCNESLNTEEVYGNSLMYKVSGYQVRDWCGLPASTFEHSWSSSSNLFEQSKRSLVCKNCSCVIQHSSRAGRYRPVNSINKECKKANRELHRWRVNLDINNMFCMLCGGYFVVACCLCEVSVIYEPLHTVVYTVSIL